MNAVRFSSFAALFLWAASHANAGLQYDWNNDPTGTKQVTNVPAGNSTGTPSTDIHDVMSAHDSTNYYFRMDLAGAPTSSDGVRTYSLQLDDPMGSGANGGTKYDIALGLTGMNHQVMSRFSTDPGAGQQLPNGPSSTDLSAVGGTVDYTENGGKTLEWSIPISDLRSGPFTMYGMAHDIDNNTTCYTPPTTCPPPPMCPPVIPNVPEPATLTLLAMSVCGALVYYRRRILCR